MCRCFMIGHREAPESLLGVLRRAVEEMIVANGVNEFIVGHYGNFDTLSREAVLAAKRHFPHVRLTLLLPYHPAERAVDVPDGVDDTYYPFFDEGVPRRAAIVRANRLAVDQCRYLIAYVTHPASNAKNILEYALRKGRTIYNVANNKTADD